MTEVLMTNSLIEFKHRRVLSVGFGLAVDIFRSKSYLSCKVRHLPLSHTP